MINLNPRDARIAPCILSAMAPPILIVEDSPTLRTVLAALLEKIGFGCDSAANGLEAVESYKKNPSYKLILMDIMMPDVDGYEAARQIREFEKREGLSPTYIVAITCVSEKQKCLDAGMDDYCQKPVDSKVLKQITEKSMSNRNPES